MIKDKVNISEGLAKQITEEIFDENKEKVQIKAICNKAISVRPNNEAKRIFTLHSSVFNVLKSYSVGTAIKNMIMQYVKLSRVERELIVFRKELNIINQSIQSKSKLFIEFSGKSIIFQPSSIIEIIDDYGNYLLGYNEDSEKMNIILLRKITKIYPNGEHFNPSGKMKKITESYQNKKIPILNEKEITALKILLNKNNLEPLFNLLNEYEKNHNMEFDRSLSDKTINAFLPTLFKIETTIEDTDIKIKINNT